MEKLFPTLQSPLFQEHFLRTPFACAGGCLEHASAGTWEKVESILTQPDVDLLIGRGEDFWNRLPPRTATAAREVLDQGYTLGIRHAERHDADLAKLSVRFGTDFLAPVNIHLYCTPAGCTGFGWHYDAEDVFVLQTTGAKNWELRKNTVNPWPIVEDLPQNMQYEREIMPIMRCALAAGDWLYIPAGYWHRTQADEMSISLSVGILSPTALTIFDYLRTHLKSSLLWRQRLPQWGSASTASGDQFDACRELCVQLGADINNILTSDQFIAAFCRHRASAGGYNGSQ